MAQAEEQARHLIAEAEKKLCTKGFFSFFKSYKNRLEEAIECYQKAGTLFKLARNWPQACAAFKIAGDLNLEENNSSEGANNYVQASKCLEKYDVKRAISFSLNAIEIYTDLGRFVMAAKLHKDIAEMHEQNLELLEAVQHYEQAADYFKVEENYFPMKKCLLKVAEYASSEFNDYNKAIDIYEDLAFCDLKIPIFRYNVKDSLFKAALCHLCVDILNGKHALDSYLEKYPDFQDTVQYEFLKTIIEYLEESDEERLDRAVTEYDNVAGLDTWHKKMLLKVRKQIKEPNLL